VSTALSMKVSVPGVACSPPLSSRRRTVGGRLLVSALRSSAASLSAIENSTYSGSVWTMRVSRLESSPAVTRLPSERSSRLASPPIGARTSV
jgi:hypothetical protein